MFNISEYLKKFAHLEKDSKFQKESIENAFKDVCGIQSVSFEVRRGVVYLKNASPLLKSMVYTKKQLLLSEIKKKLSTIYDIR